MLAANQRHGHASEAAQTARSHVVDVVPLTLGLLSVPSGSELVDMHHHFALDLQEICKCYSREAGCSGEDFVVCALYHMVHSVRHESNKRSVNHREIPFIVVSRGARMAFRGSLSLPLQFQLSYIVGT